VGVDVRGRVLPQRLPIAYPLAAVMALLLVFQLLVRGGVAFY
jgi:hypothetical protein